MIYKTVIPYTVSPLGEWFWITIFKSVTLYGKAIVKWFESEKDTITTSSKSVILKIQSL